jgi:hypothetical protein
MIICRRTAIAVGDMGGEADDELVAVTSGGAGIGGYLGDEGVDAGEVEALRGEGVCGRRVTASRAA